MTERRLNVFISSTLVGELVENNGLWLFTYDESWLNAPNAYPLAPYLPLRSAPHVDTGSYRPVQWLFDNLLPEEAARVLLARDLRASTEDAFSMLEAIGAESAGALSLLAPQQNLATGKYVPLSNDEISRRIRNLPRMPMNDRSRKRMSLAGAQHKMLVVSHQNQLFEPSGDYPSTHILKPEHSQPDLYPFTVRNEFFCMRLARLCGLDVPEVDIGYVPEAYYLVERFDRVGALPDLQRLHVLDGCQMLGLSAGAKYRLSTVDTLVKLQHLCRSKAKTALRLFRWILFNFYIGNGDAHLKNLTFVFAPDGVELMPHYDLLSTIIYEPLGQHLDAELSQPLGNAQYFGQVTVQDLLAVGEAFGLRGNVAAKEISFMAKQVSEHSASLIDEYASSANHAGKSGELRMLRQIQHLAIGELTALG
ncbi:HipA domain-containing protein [Pseudidiomarina donghaiensis]|uniref:HipA domain-containing protein n=1 Tax=Pseudidiomarina donghaiensis TaxID=519452 RepID=UPI003A975462